MQKYLLVGGYFRNCKDELFDATAGIYTVAEALTLGFVNGVDDYCLDVYNKDFYLLSENTQAKMIVEYTASDEIARLYLCKNIVEAKNKLDDIKENIRYFKEEQIVKNLRLLIGTEFNSDSIIEAFEDYNEEDIIVNNDTGIKSNFDGYGECDLVSIYENVEDATEYSVYIKNGVIIDVQ